ncbi:MAG: sugar phosphate nucleotidyltransferase, partial [Promethearchaeota archaeon]
MSIPTQENIPILLLAAGEAKRLEPLSREIIKPIVPICGTPIINMIIESYYQNGFRDFIIVLGIEEENIKKAINDLEIVKNSEISVEYAYQSRPMGMADAILSAEPILRKKLDEGCEYFFVSAVDVFFNEDVPKNMYRGLDQNENIGNVDILLSLIYSDDPQMSIGHGNASLDLKDEDNFKKIEKNKNKLLKIKKIVEKPCPDKRISNYYSMPIYIFRTTLFDYMRKLQKSSRGEYELQDVIEEMILDNKAVYGLDIMGKDDEPINYKNIGKYHITYMKDFLLMNFR